MRAEEIVFEKSKDGLLTVKRNDLYLHSKYRPKDESINFIRRLEGVKEKKHITIYGLALGYHIESLLNIIEKDVKVDIFDLDSDLYKEANKRGFYNFIKKDVRVKVNIGDDKEIYQKIGESIEKSETLIIYEPSLKSIEENYSFFANSLRIFQRSFNDKKIYTKLAEENIISNKKVDYKFLSDFYKTVTFKDEDVMIVASGPSIDEAIENIKKYRGNFKIISVGSSFRTLMDKGIIPDAVVIIDMKQIIRKQLMGYEDSKVPLCFLDKASKWAVESYKGPKYMFFNEEPIVGEELVETGKTVAVAALNIALKVNPKRIIFVGQDLAYINNRSHGESVEKIYNVSLKIKDNVTKHKVKGIVGRDLETNSGYLYYKRQIEMSIEKNKKVEFFNCSRGADIKGTKVCSLDDIYK